MNNVLKVHNPNNLPTMSYTQFVEFQGDLKEPMTPENLKKMKGSLKKHGVFVPKFVWFDEQHQANILDGHQTKQALSSLESDGWEIPEIPYTVIETENQQDAAEKLLQINSRYAVFNPSTTWFDDLEFHDVPGLLESVSIPGVNDEWLKQNQGSPDTTLAKMETTGIYPVHNIHVLLSFPVDRYLDVVETLEVLEQLDFVEYRQGGN